VEFGNLNRVAAVKNQREGEAAFSLPGSGGNFRLSRIKASDR